MKSEGLKGRWFRPQHEAARPVPARGDTVSGWGTMKPGIGAHEVGPSWLRHSLTKAG